MSIPRWRSFILAGTFMVLAYYSLPEGVARRTAFVLVGIAAALAILKDVRSKSINRPGPWVLLGLGVATLTASYALGPDASSVSKMPASAPFFDEGAHLIACLLIAAGLVGFFRERDARRDSGLLLDATIIALSCGVLSWTFLMEPHLADTSLDTARRLFAMALPLGDLLVLFTAVRLAIGPGEKNGSYNLLLGGVIIFLFADTLHLASTVAGVSGSESALVAGLLVAFIALGASALHPSAGWVSYEGDGQELRLTISRTVMLGFASMAGPVGTVAAGLRGEASETYAAALATGVITTLVLIRMAGLVRILAGAIAKRQDAETRKRSEQRFRALVQNHSDIVAVVDSQGQITFLSPAVERVLGHDPGGLMGRPIENLLHRDEAPQFRAQFKDTLRKSPTKLHTADCRVRHSDGSYKHVEVTMMNLTRDPDVEGVVINARDVTERIELQAEMTRQAFHDPLTGLANRALFRDRVELALAHGRRSHNEVAVLFCDLDDFKRVNDSLGHAAGDELLRGVAQRLTRCVREADTPARLGGDEFAILLIDAEDMVVVAERLTKALEKPFKISGKDVSITTSIGIAQSHLARENADDLLRNADVAMYEAKGRGKSRYAIFTQELHDAAVKRIDIEAELRQAVKKDEFEVHYQPIVALEDGKVRGFEALVRWDHPERGMLPPLEFISIAEESGLIIPIGRKVLADACRQAFLWSERYPSDTPLTMSVNISATQLEAQGLEEMVAAAISDSGIEPSQLILEITENVIMRDDAQTEGTLADLKALGIQLAIDDFGTGYSSLSYLQRFPMDWLKLPRPFLENISEDQRSEALARGIVELSHNLGLHVVAEGIEHSYQWEGLRGMGCELGQGFHFAKPAHPERAETVLEPAKQPLRTPQSDQRPTAASSRSPKS